MTYAFSQDVPIDAAMYKRITDRLGDDPPPGLIAHLVVERPEGGLALHRPVGIGGGPGTGS